jgi:hypothetical protein
MTSRALGRLAAAAVAATGAGLLTASVSGVASLDARLAKQTGRPALPVTEEVVDRHVLRGPCDEFKPRAPRPAPPRPSSAL